MSTFDIDDLRRLLTEVAGEAEGAVPPHLFGEQDFDTLGYDSLARMEVASRLWQQHGVRIPDDLLFDVRTPQELLDLVNGAVAGVS